MVLLTSAAVASLGLTIIPSGLARAYAANEKLSIALIGCGGRSQWFCGAIPRFGENIVAMCDPHEERAATSFAMLPDVPKHHDFTEARR